MINCRHDFDEYGECFECGASLTAANQAKANGLTNLKQVSDLTGVSLQTLDNWYKHKPKLFEIVLEGCVTRLGLNKSTKDNQRG